MEYSIINFRYIKGIPDIRIDAECYKPNYLQAEKLVSEFNRKTIGELAKSVINFGAYSLCNYIQFSEKGIPFIVTEDINNNIINDSNFHFVSSEIHKMLHKSHCRKGQVLLTMAGAYLGQAAVYDFEFISSSNQAIAKITLNNNTIDPYFLSTFINSKYGQLQIERFRTGTGQPNLNLGLIKTLVVPILSSEFQESIKNIVILAKKTLHNSISFYNEAEDMLLEELGLSTFAKATEDDKDLFWVVDLSDVKYANRIDSDFFQPKYAEIIKKIKTRKDGWDTLDHLTSLIGHPSNPPYENNSSENKTFIITQKHLTNYFPADKFWEDADALYTTDEFIKNNAIYLLKENDIILYSVGAYIGKANIYNSNIKATIGSFLTLIRPKQELINPFCLLVFLNSSIGQLLTRRNSRGLAQQYIYPYDTKKMPIPKLDDGIQKEIEKLIKKGHEARKKSKELLEQAKREVEKMIEKGSA